MAKRKKKKVNSKLLFVLVGGVALVVLAAVGWFVIRRLPRNPVPIFQEAQALAAAKNWEAASHEFQRAVSHSRNDFDLNIQYRLAFADFLMQWRSEVEGLTPTELRAITMAWRKQVEAVVNTAPKHLEARSLWTEHCWEIARASGTKSLRAWETFIKSAETQMRLSPDDASLYNRCATAYATLANADREYVPGAIAALAMNVGADRANANAYRSWALFLLQDEKTAHARDTLGGRDGVSSEEVFAGIDALTKAKLAKEDAPRKASRMLEKLSPNDVYSLGVQSNPESMLLRVELAQFLRSKGQVEQAQAQIDAVLAVQDADADGLLALAAYYLTYEPAGDSANPHVKALACLQQAREKDPKLIAVYERLSAVHQARGEFDLSEQVCRDGLALLAEERGDRKLEDLDPDGRNRQITGGVPLQVSLALTLVNTMPADAEQRQARMGQVQGCLDAVGEFIPNLEDGQLAGPAFHLQLVVTKMRARLALIKGELFEAQRLYRLVYDRNPVLDEDAANELVKLYTRHGESTEAERILAQYLGKHPKNVTALLLQAQLQLNRHAADQAEETLARLKALDLTEQQSRSAAAMEVNIHRLRREVVTEASLPGDDTVEADVPQWVAQIRYLQDLGETGQALEVAEELRMRFPGNESAVSILVELHMAAGQADRALAVVAEAIGHNPESAWLKKTKQMLETPPAERQEALVQQVMETKEGVARELALAKIYLHGPNADQDKYVEHMAKAVEIDPKAGDSLDTLFNVYLQNKRLDEAAALVVKATELNLQGTGGKVYQARLLMEQDKIDEAYVVLQEALAMRPQYSIGHALMGRVLLVREDYDGALVSFTKSYEQNHRNVMALTGLAQLAERDGRFADHEKWVYQAYSHAPYIDYIRHSWLRYQQAKVSAEEFLADCTSLYQRYPNDLDLVLRMASAYERLNPPQWDKAESIYRQVYDSRKRESDAMAYLERLMLFYNRAGMVDAAEKLLAEDVAEENRLAHSLIKAKFLMQNRRNEEARTLIDEVIAQAPDDVRGYLFLATWAVETAKDWPTAVGAMEKIVELAPDSRTHWDRYVQMMLQAKMYDKASQKVALRLETHPNDADATAMLGQIHHIQGRVDEALPLYDKAIEMDPGQGRALRLRSQIYLDRGRIDESLVDLETAYKSSPSPAMAILLAQRYVDAQEQWDRAKETLNNALIKFPDSAPLLQKLGDVCLKTLDWRGLQSALQRGRQAQPRAAIWSVLEARMWKATEKPEQCAAAMKIAHELAPTDLSVTLEYADALLNADRYQDALSLVASVSNPPAVVQISLAAVSGRAHWGLGDQTQGMQDFQMAFYASESSAVTRRVARDLELAVGAEQSLQMMAQWVNARENAPLRIVLAEKIVAQGKDAVAEEILAGTDMTGANKANQFEIHRNLGLLRERLGEVEAAREAYEAALAIQAEDATSLNNLAYLLAEHLKKPDAAIPYAEKAVALQPANANMADTLGWIYYQAGQVEKARKKLEQSLQIQKTAAALYHLGLIYEKQNRSRDARKLFQDGFDLVKGDPSHPFYNDLKTSLGRSPRSQLDVRGVMMTMNERNRPMRPAGPRPGGPGRPGSAPETGITGKDILRILRRRWLMITLFLVGFSICSVAGTVIWRKYLPQYEAFAYVELAPPKNSMTAAAPWRNAEMLDRHKKSQAGKVKLQSVLRSALESEEMQATQWFREMTRNDPEWGRAITDLEERISVGLMPETDHIRITMRMYCSGGQERKELPVLVETITDAFVDEVNSAQKQQRQAEIDAVEDSLSLQKDIATRAHNEIAAKRRNMEVPAMQSKMDSVSLELNELIKTSQDLRAKVTEWEEALRNIHAQEEQGMLASNPMVQQALEIDPVLRGMEAELKSGKSNMEFVRSKYGPRHQIYKSLEIRISGLELQVQARREQLTQSNIASMKTFYQQELRKGNMQLVSYMEEREGLLSKRKDLVASLDEISQLEEQAAAAEEEIRTWNARLQELEMLKDKDLPAKVAHRPTMPILPVGPSLMMWTALGIMLGAGLGGGLAFLLELTDTSIKTPTDVARRVQLPLLAMIPHEEDMEDEVEDFRLVCKDHGHSMVAEAFRELRTNLEFSGPLEGRRSLLVTSPSPDDGRTTVAVNMALSIASTGRRVLLVDANFRRPAVGELFSVANDQGLSDVLSGQVVWTECVHETDTENLTVMAAGKLPPNPNELLGSQLARTILEEMTAQYDQVIFDAPPLLLISDARVLATAVDGVVLVVRAGVNTYGIAQRSRNTLAQIGAHTVGGVLNGIRTTAGGYLQKNYEAFQDYHEMAEV